MALNYSYKKLNIIVLILLFISHISFFPLASGSKKKLLAAAASNNVILMVVGKKWSVMKDADLILGIFEFYHNIEMWRLLLLHWNDAEQ